MADLGWFALVYLFWVTVILTFALWIDVLLHRRQIRRERRQMKRAAERWVSDR